VRTANNFLRGVKFGIESTDYFLYMFLNLSWKTLKSIRISTKKPRNFRVKSNATSIKSKDRIRRKFYFWVWPKLGFGGTVEEVTHF